jgi:hypothetical protein
MADANPRQQFEKWIFSYLLIAEALKDLEVRLQSQ